MFINKLITAAFLCLAPAMPPLGAWACFVAATPQPLCLALAMDCCLAPPIAVPAPVFLLLALLMPSCCLAPSHPGLSCCGHTPFYPLLCRLAPPIAAPHHLCPLLLGQCTIPAFEDLLDGDHNKRLLKLLYWTAEWHGLAKLRMHTWATLDHLESLTNEYGRLMRSFRDLTCSQFKTKELQREVDV